MRKVAGPASGRCAVILPGSASTGEFAARALGPALAALGLATVSADPAALGDPDAQLGALDAAVREWDPVLVGGVSLGAHLAARWAAGRSPGRVAGLLLVMPAWTGEPGPVAAASAAAAGEVERAGIGPVLARIAAGAAPESAWVAAELASAWPRYSPGALVSALRATAASRGPSPTELAAIRVPCGIVALRDDPLHPAAVAREWAATIRVAALTETGLAAAGADRATLGRAAVHAWLRAGGHLNAEVR
jgi:pimeloyl-ACP methyl ester carboxylesterase